MRTNEWRVLFGLSLSEVPTRMIAMVMEDDVEFDLQVRL